MPRGSGPRAPEHEECLTCLAFRDEHLPRTELRPIHDALEVLELVIGPAVEERNRLQGTIRTTRV